MIYYHVLLGKKHIDLVQATDEEHAIKIVLSRFGPANQFSIEHDYKAVRA